MMKKITVLSTSLLLMAVLLLPVVVLAHEEDETVAQTQTTKTPEQLATERQERVQKRKTELKIAQTNAQKQRLTGRCKAAQTLVGVLNGRVKGVQTVRSDAYGRITGQLDDLLVKLQAKGANTTELQTAITTLKDHIHTFTDDLADYQQAVNDTAEIDCVADPDGFKASLETARSLKTKLKEDGTVIRAYLKETIKPLLQTIRAQLAGGNQ